MHIATMNGSEYIETYLDEAECVAAFNVVANAPYSLYEYARLESWLGVKQLKRAPKTEWYVQADGRRPLYRWGQSKRFEHAGNEMPPIMMDIVDKIKRDFGETVNHSIAIYYHSGVDQHAPPHKDKAIGLPVKKGVPLDMAKDSSFFVFSFGDPRVFTLQKTSKTKKGDRDVAWEKALAHGSLLRISAKDNRELYHAVHKASVKHKARYSLIFRNILTTRPIDIEKQKEANGVDHRFVPTSALGKRPRGACK